MGWGQEYRLRRAIARCIAKQQDLPHTCRQQTIKGIRKWWYCWKLFYEELVVSTAPRPLSDIILQLSPRLHRGEEEWPRNVVSSPDPTYKRGSGDIRLIPQASLMLITFRRESSLHQSHCRNTICTATPEILGYFSTMTQHFFWRVN